MVARLTLFFLLLYDQCQYEPFDLIDSRFNEPYRDHTQDFRVRLECIIKSRGVNEDDRIAGSRMCNSDGPNFCCARLPTMTDGIAGLASSIFDELVKVVKKLKTIGIKKFLTVLLPAPVGPITL